MFISSLKTQQALFIICIKKLRFQGTLEYYTNYFICKRRIESFVREKSKRRGGGHWNVHGRNFMKGNLAQ